MKPGSKQNRDFLALLLPNEEFIRNFIFSIHPTSRDLEDIMQDTAISLWEKFEFFDASRPFLPWALRLAYFEVLRFRKKRSRDRLVFTGEVVDMLADEFSEEEELTEPVHQALDSCLSQLDGLALEVVHARYGQGTSISDLAEARKEPAHRLYRVLEKVREKLVECVRQRLSEGGHPFFN